MRYHVLSIVLLLFFENIAAQKIIFTPQWTAQSQFAGYYAALKLGYYKEEGLDVEILYPAISENPYQLLENGKSNIITLNLDQALAYKANGGDLLNVMQTSHLNSLILVSHTPIKEFSVLKKKKIAVWNYLSDYILELIKSKYNLDVQWIKFNGGVNIFLSKAVDVCLVSSFNEFNKLSECGFDISKNNMLKLSDCGYDLPEEGVYVSEKYYEDNKVLVDSFVKASIRGWLWVRQNREEALAIVWDEIKRNKVATNKYHERNMLDEILRLQNYKNSNPLQFKLNVKEFENAKMKLFMPKAIGMAIKYGEFVK